MKSSRFAYTGIRVSNLDRSIDFYTKALGMLIVRRGEMPHGGKYVGLRNPRSKVELELIGIQKLASFLLRLKKTKQWIISHLQWVKTIQKAYQEVLRKGAAAVSPKTNKRGL